MRCKLLMVAFVATASVVAGQVATAPPVAAAAIDVSNATQHRIRYAVNRYAEIQVAQREPYCYGGTGPGCFDCSGLVMMAYRDSGVNIPRTSEEQWVWGPRIAPGHEEPGDLIFFAGSDGTTTSPGHVGMVIGHGMMIEAFATGFPIRIAPYRGRQAVGFTRPWAHSGVVL